MLQKFKEFLYVWSTLIWVIVLVVLILVFCHNYERMIDRNTELISQVEDEKDKNDLLCSLWAERYYSLQDDYYDQIAENTKMRKRLQNLELLSKCVQCEAGEENVQAQRCVTSVIMNRLESDEFADNIPGVIYEEVDGCPQFSVAWDGAIDNCELSPAVLANVYSVLLNGSELPPHVKYFYSATLEEDNWVKDLEVYNEVEGTIFSYCKEDLSHE